MDVSSIIILVLAILFIVSLILYLIFGYDKVTQKKIAKAIEKRDIMNREIKESKYIAKSIMYLCDINGATCIICRKNVSSRKYRIKNDVGTRDIPICNECLEKFKINEKKR